MSSSITIILFFTYLWGLGFTATSFVRDKPSNIWERQLLNLGIGLGIFPILSIFLNFLHVPLDWRIFLLLSLAFPLGVFVRKIAKKQLPTVKDILTNLKPQVRLTKSNLILLGVLCIFAFSFFMYTKGAFSYPYLEDEDPWGHSVGVKYVALEKNAYDPPVGEPGQVDPVLSYIDPYPPAYDILLGILHQTSPELQWTMKFFNALIISLSLIFFYLFAKEFMRNQNKALLATFFLAAIPAYLSHFIWAHALAVTIFFPTVYAFYKIREDSRWMYPAIILLASVWVSQ
ncbi:MAG: phospholipid carrier-dependent glycosyltransferase, partial [Nanoarchaeota archaeon]|nr:phospholipid carrier-dependent glycosyltransferase [Nanoarchaeota archaeon]